MSVGKLTWRQTLSVASMGACAVEVMLGWGAWLSVLTVDSHSSRVVVNIHAVGAPVSAGLLLAAVYGFMPLPFMVGWISPVPVRWRQLLVGAIAWGTLAGGSMSVWNYTNTHRPPAVTRSSATTLGTENGAPALVRRDGTVERYLSESEYRALLIADRVDTTTIAMIFVLLVIPITGIRLFQVTSGRS